MPQPKIRWTLFCYLVNLLADGQDGKLAREYTQDPDILQLLTEAEAACTDDSITQGSAAFRLEVMVSMCIDVRSSREEVQNELSTMSPHEQMMFLRRLLFGHLFQRMVMLVPVQALLHGRCQQRRKAPATRANKRFGMGWVQLGCRVHPSHF